MYILFTYTELQCTSTWFIAHTNVGSEVLTAAAVKSSGIVPCKLTDVSEERITSIFWVED
jgi:hypothetical protein